MERTEAAVKRFGEGYSCSQAVFCAFADKFDLEEETARKIAAGFGGGMGMGETCGAVTGAFMALGLLFDPAVPEIKEKMHELTRAFAARFTEESNALTCRDIMGCDLTTPEGKNYALQNNLRTTICAQQVRLAVSLTQEFLGIAD